MHLPFAQVDTRRSFRATSRRRGWNPESSGVRVGHHTPASLAAAGRVGYFGEHRGEASSPKCVKFSAGCDAVGGVPLAVHRVPRGGRDRLAERRGVLMNPRVQWIKRMASG
jgi:hypothetical protein